MSNPLLVRCRISSLTFIVPQIWPLQILRAPKYTISGCRRFATAQNTQRRAVADFTMLEIHYFWLSQILQRPKYTISGRRRFYNARNTLFLVVADFAALEIHYFWPPQICNNPSLCSTAFRIG